MLGGVLMCGNDNDGRDLKDFKREPDEELKPKDFLEREVKGLSDGDEAS